MVSPQWRGGGGFCPRGHVHGLLGALPAVPAISPNGTAKPRHVQPALPVPLHRHGADPTRQTFSHRRGLPRCLSFQFKGFVHDRTSARTDRRGNPFLQDRRPHEKAFTTWRAWSRSIARPSMPGTRDPQAFRVQEHWLTELAAISHRGYCTGFYFGDPDQTAANLDKPCPFRLPLRGPGDRAGSPWRSKKSW